MANFVDRMPEGGAGCKFLFQNYALGRNLFLHDLGSSQAILCVSAVYGVLPLAWGGAGERGGSGGDCGFFGGAGGGFCSKSHATHGAKDGIIVVGGGGRAVCLAGWEGLPAATGEAVAVPGVSERVEFPGWREVCEAVEVIPGVDSGRLMGLEGHEFP